MMALQTVSKVITGKNPLPVLDNFLFELSDGELVVTASDAETTLKYRTKVDEVMETGSAAIHAKLMEVIKEFPDQPLELQTNDSAMILNIKWITGNSEIPFSNADEYPVIPELSDEHKALVLDAGTLMEAVSRTQYATSSDESKPALSGLYFDMGKDYFTVVGTDAQKLAFYRRHDIKAEEPSSFILAKKPSSILKALLPKSDAEVSITYDSKNAYFAYDSTLMVTRLTEGVYPAYQSIIPNNSNHLIVNRLEFLHAMRRVSVCSNKGSNLLKLGLSLNQVNISAQDTEFSFFASEDMPCQYEGDPMNIGFKATILIDIISNLPYEDICLQLHDPGRAVLIVGAYVSPDAEEEVSALIMPVLIMQ